MTRDLWSALPGKSHKRQVRQTSPLSTALWDANSRCGLVTCREQKESNFRRLINWKNLNAIEYHSLFNSNEVNINSRFTAQSSPCKNITGAAFSSLGVYGAVFCSESELCCISHQAPLVSAWMPHGLFKVVMKVLLNLMIWLPQKQP